MKTNRIIIILTALSLLLPVRGIAQVSGDGFRAARTGTVGLSLDEGLSWSLGGGFANIGTDNMNLIQPSATAGVFYNFSPLVRAGAYYGYTRMVRGQLTDPDAGGVFYRDFKSRFHSAHISGEVDLVELFSKGLPHRLSVYAGAGAGLLLANGNTLEKSCSTSYDKEKMVQTTRFAEHNDPHRYRSAYVPVTLTVEYAFLPQVSLRLAGSGRILTTKTDIAPKSQVSATAGLVFNIK